MWSLGWHGFFILLRVHNIFYMCHVVNLSRVFNAFCHMNLNSNYKYSDLEWDQAEIKQKINECNINVQYSVWYQSMVLVCKQWHGLFLQLAATCKSCLVSAQLCKCVMFLMERSGCVWDKWRYFLSVVQRSTWDHQSRNCNKCQQVSLRQQTHISTSQFKPTTLKSKKLHFLNVT